MTDEGTYLCSRCNKHHSNNYHRHKKYSVGHLEGDKQWYIEQRINSLQDTLDNVVELLKKWSVYMERHVRNYSRFPDELK